MANQKTADGGKRSPIFSFSLRSVRDKELVSILDNLPKGELSEFVRDLLYDGLKYRGFEIKNNHNDFIQNILSNNTDIEIMEEVEQPKTKPIKPPTQKPVKPQIPKKETGKNEELEKRFSDEMISGRLS